MKANEAPEKIYIPMSKYWYGIDSVFYPVRQYKNDTEYVRTDAFIEKACEGIEHLLSGYVIRNFHFGDSYEMDTLIEDFKNIWKKNKL